MPASSRRALPLVAAALGCFCSADRVEAQVPPPAAEEGFEAIFDGRSLEGWDGWPGYWGVENGVLVGRTSAERPLPHNTFLVWTAGWVGDFELRFSYRILSGNSGVQYRSVLHDDWRVSGYQADLEAGSEYTGQVYEEGGRGILAGRGEVVRCTERGRNLLEDRFATAEALEAKLRKSDWNQVTIRAEGPVLSHSVNGVLFARLIDEQSTHAAREGILALQLHAGAPTEVHFKDLRVRHLARSATPPDPNQATPAEAIRVPEGFQVERLYSVPREQGSWVSLAVDPRGRLLACDQYGGLFRIDGLGRGETVRVEPVAAEVGMSQGMLFVGEDLYLTVNGDAAQGSGVYRLRDRDGDGSYEERTLLKKLAGEGEHGPHGLVLGPDGWIYVIAGNMTQVPDGCAESSPHRNWGEDLLLPRRPDGRGHATGVMAPGGWVARFTPDGERWELVCGGMRNAYDLAFHPDGELFTFDADMEWDLGTPWYRPTRVLHLRSGGEFGWRYGTGKWPTVWPDSLPAVVDLGESSPTGLLMGTELRFPRRYRQALFVADWTFGKIHAVWLEPDGASYRGRFEPFVEGRPLAVTDLVAGADGHLYFTIGGRRIQSGLYRVRAFHPDFEPLAVHAEGAQERATRRQLEALHGRAEVAGIDVAWDHLDDPDRAIRARYAARIAIEHRPVEAWRERALAETRPHARLEAAIALARCGVASDQPALLRALAAADPETMDDAALIAWLRAHALAFLRLAPVQPAQRTALAQRIGRLFPRGSEMVDRELCRLLVHLEHPAVVPEAMALVENGKTQEEQLFYIFVLRNAKQGWNLPLRTSYFSWLQFAPRRYQGGMSFESFLVGIREDAASQLDATEREQLAVVLEPPQPRDAALSPAPVRRFVRRWQMADLLPRLNEVGAGRDYDRGERAFLDLQCLACHTFGREGGATGPVLSTVGQRFSRRDLLESLLEPSRTVSDQYQNEMLVTSWDEIFVGRVVHEDERILTLKTHPLDEHTENLARKDIVERRPSTLSPMPNGLLDVLSAEEILDLLAYLESGGDERAPAFTKGR